MLIISKHFSMETKSYNKPQFSTGPTMLIQPNLLPIIVTLLAIGKVVSIAFSFLQMHLVIILSRVRPQ